jgi:Undecaprenyl-phosphate glucose phosphotransferase
VVIGTGESAQRLIGALARAPATRYRVVGVIDDRIDDSAVDPSGARPEPIDGAPVLGGLDRLVAAARDDRIDEVLVALPWGEEDRLAAVLDRLSPLPLHVRLVPDPIAFQFAHRPVTRLSGVPLIHLFERPISGWSWLLKAAEDRVLASLALLFLGPLMLLIALAIKLDSPGPVFFRQPRRGFNSRLFQVWKFRTMYHDRADLACATQTTRNDPRITRVGAILRKTSLDELPQLLNVLNGDMSLVGPRPHAVATKAAGRLFEEVVREYAARYRVRPGITGWAQVNGWRGETDTVEKIEKRVEYDIHYIENWSIGLDLWILIRTALLVFRDDRAY